MSSSQLPNYLLSNRKRLGLSQEEVAFLLGDHRGSRVCRHEHFSRTPDLEVALAYEVIFKRSLSELFGGLYQKVEKEVRKRAKVLLEQKSVRPPGRRSAQKRKVLRDLADC
jgi:transcriptional regulator with XRE-family HTH domain